MNSTVVINLKNNDEQCFKWAVIAALHNKEIKHHPEYQCNWKELKFLLATQKIGKFQKINPGIALNVLFNSKKGIYTTRRSELNGKGNKQAKLLVIVDGEIRHLKNFSKLLYSLNATNKRACHFCMNYFHPDSARENIMSTAVAMVKMTYEKEKWPMFPNGQYQFKAPVTLDRL